MLEEFHCEGAPRDLGLDQGRACRDALRDRFSQSPFWERWGLPLGPNERAATRIARDLRRHFPQQSEALEGMVRGADVPLAWLAAVHARELGAEAPPRVGAGVAFGADASRAGGALVARPLACEPVVRHSRPEGGFASVELTLPWFTASLAGVNEGGLAATCVSLPGGLTDQGCTVPAAHLIQDCLMRFDSIKGAVDWCSGRPCGGRATVLFAEASGDIAAVDVDGRARVTRAPEEGLLFAGDDTGAFASLRECAKPELATAAKLLGGRVAGLDPSGRRIGVFDGASGDCAWFEVQASEPDGETTG